MKAETISLATAAIAAIGLVGVAYALILQTRQTKVAQAQAKTAQVQAMRNYQLELFRLAFEDPALQDGWSQSIDLPYDQWKLRTYMNLIWMYLRMGYMIGDINDATLRRTLANRLRTQAGRDYWKASRSAFNTGVLDRATRVFYDVAEEEYKRSLSEPPIDAPAPRPEGRSSAETGI